MRNLFTLLLSAFAGLAHGQVFPRDYESSRAAFRAQVSASRAPAVFTRAYAVASASDPDLSVDVAYFGGHGRKLLILQSGIHGVEGPAGTDSQMLFMHEHLEAFLKQGVDVLLIHALDPYGFKYHRRTDEQNVNLNRNFSSNQEVYHRKNPDYAGLRDILEPTSPIISALGKYEQTHLQLLTRLVSTGFQRRKITSGMNSGQYEYARGINFGGVKASEQVTLLRDLLSEILPDHERVIFVDLHTGLGDKGVLHLMLGSKSNSDLRALVQANVRRISSKSVKVTDTGDKGFFNTTGDVIDFVAEVAPPTTQLLAMTAEFGTLGSGIPAQLYSASLMVAENQARVHGCLEPSTCAQVQLDFIELFDPSDAQWRRSVLSNARALFALLRESVLD